jgi:Flp pilus assembly protein TadB
VPERPRNPFRNEADAFRVLVMCVAVGAVVVAVALLLGTAAGVAVGLVFIAIGLWRTWGLWRSWRQTGFEPR